MAVSRYIAAALFAAGAGALTQQYCSSQNTGSGTQATFNTWQSNGACFDTCKSSYAFAIVQYQNCWCSNYAPSDQESVSNCNQGCPGYDIEDCGNEDTGLFGYIALSIAPSGTAGASSSSTRSVTPKGSSTSSSSSSTGSDNTPETSTQVVTISGAIITQTVTSAPRASGTASSSSVRPTAEDKGTSTGAVVGAVIGAIAGILLLALALFFFWRRRRAGKPVSASLNRNASVLSKAGLLATGRNHDAEKSMDEPHFGSQRHSALYGDPQESPVSAPSGVYDAASQQSRRNSRPLLYDQRLNPAALMENWQANGSRASVNTMQDQRDYSRPLGVTNPDP